MHPLPVRVITLERVPHLPRPPRQQQKPIVLKIQQRPRWIIQPRPHRHTRRSLHRKSFRRTIIRHHKTRIHQLRVRERESVEEVLMNERRIRVCIRKLAVGRDGHVEECVVEVEGGVVEGSCQDARGVQGADGEVSRRWCADVRDGRAVPMVPLEGGGADRGGPEVGGDVDLEVAGGDVVEGGDDDGLVDVFGYVVEDFPSAIVLDTRPRGCLPDVFQLPVQRS